MNHCALEGLFSSKNPVQSDCQSHPEGDPGSHPEGSPCSQSVISSFKQSTVAQALVSVDLIPQTNLSEPTASLQVLLSAREVEDIALADTTLLISLSIASNAPPVIA